MKSIAMAGLIAIGLRDLIRRPGIRANEANAAFAKAVVLRPGATALNVGPPTRNASPVFIDASKRVTQEIVAIGLPEG